MGTTASVINSTTPIRLSSDEPYIPMALARMNDERGIFDLSGPSSACLLIHRASLLRTAFTGIWSIFISPSPYPSPRTGHFTYYDSSTHTAFIGYGLTSSSTPLFDLWRLDTFTYKWTSIPLHGHLLPGRAGTRCSLIGTHLVLFGGYSEPTYFSDLHTIDINTGEVSLVSTQGSPPSPRSTAIVAIYNHKLYVWGGFNGDWPSELNILDFSTMTWTQHSQETSGRTAVSFVIAGNILYSYGGSQSGGMLCLNLDTFEIRTRETIGTEPPNAVTGAGMVRIGKYLFFFGGRANSEWTLMYACDLHKMWWFIFHIEPDGETVSVADGSVSDIGLFMLPRIHSFGMCYVHEKRQIVAFLGYPEKDPPPIFVVSCGEALSVINLRDDLIDALKNGL
jgi:hypothetical protein